MTTRRRSRRFGPPGPTIDATTTPRRGASNEAPDSQTELVGTTLAGRYHIEALLGAGGMGRVYRGRHLSLGIPVAVKMMSARVASDVKAVERFAREARATSRLQHRNVVRIHDYGIEGDQPYIVMELLRGEALIDRYDRTRLPDLATMQQIMVQLCDGLEAAHASGVVHRDLKPDNVFLAEEADGDEIVKILDFGLARLLDVAPDARLTSAGDLAGTPEYMSPEQCRSLDVGPSTDIYALGCILTRLLQGTPPFTGGSPVDIISRHLFLPAPKLDRPATEAPVPEALERLRLDLLAKSPDGRPKTAAAVKHRLVEALSQPGPARARAQVAVDRAARIPSWNPPPADAQAPVPASASLEVAYVRLAEAQPGGLESDLRVALSMRGVTCVEAPTARTICVVLDAGTMERGVAWLESRGPLSTLPVIVCCEGTAISSLQRLIAAGAAEVHAYPLTLEGILKRIERVSRRSGRRPSTP